MNQPAKLVLFTLGIAAFAAQAEVVGRTEFELPAPEWRLLTTFDTGLRYSQGSIVAGPTTIPIRHKVYQLSSPDGTVKALLDVASTDGGFTATRWVTDMCPKPRSKYFTEDFGANQTSRMRECLIVNQSFGPHNYYKPESEVIKAINEKGLKLFKSGYSLRTTYGSRFGTYVHVNLMTEKSFTGLTGSAPAAQELHDVSPDLVAWGESLHKSVSESALSMGGKLVLPPIEFRD